jgi:hypothetical protein
MKEKKLLFKKYFFIKFHEWFSGFTLMLTYFFPRGLLKRELLKPMLENSEFLFEITKVRFFFIQGCLPFF